MPSAGPEAGVVASSVYSGGRRVKDITIEEAGEWSQRPGHVVWIGLYEPSSELLQRVQAQLRLHYLAIEDAGKAHQHPKIEQYGEALFVVARTALPELKWRYGYFLVIGVIAAICSSLYWRFHRNGWV